MMHNLISYFGFSRTPFGRDLAPSMLHRHSTHNEAVARIGWCIADRRIGVITGEVEPGSHYYFPFPGCLIRSRSGPDAALLWMFMVTRVVRAGCSGLVATSWPRRFMALQRTRRLAVVAVGWPGPCVGHG